MKKKYFRMNKCISNDNLLWLNASNSFILFWKANTCSATSVKCYIMLSRLRTFHPFDNSWLYFSRINIQKLALHWSLSSTGLVKTLHNAFVRRSSSVSVKYFLVTPSLPSSSKTYEIFVKTIHGSKAFQSPIIFQLLFI